VHSTKCATLISYAARGNHAVEDEQVEFFVHVPMKPPICKVAPTIFLAGKAPAVAFWCVGSTDHQNDASMELAHITKKNIEVPVYTNMVDIMSNTNS